jgi:acyl carrier protein
VDSFYADLAGIMEVGEIQEHDVLRGLPEWDSLTALSVIAHVRTRYGLTLSATDLRAVETASDLRNLIEAKRVS